MSLPRVKTGSTLVKMSVKRFRASSELESPFSSHDLAAMVIVDANIPRDIVREI
jgi:hypothetical protein